jgi:hypothetical protein
VPISPFLDEKLPALAPAEARYVWGKVTQSSPLRIQLDGDRFALPITPDDMGRTPRAVNQRVYCQILNRRLVVMGPTSAYSALLGASVDLNTQTSPGAVVQPLNANASLALNYPAAVAGLLEVHARADGLMVFQRYSSYDPAKPYIWQRTYYSGTWGAWVEVSALPLPVTSGVFTAATNWTITAQAAVKKNQSVFAQVSLTYTGPPVTVPTDGNISNQTFATCDAAWLPLYSAIRGTLSTVGSGPVVAAYVVSSGACVIPAVAPGFSFVSGVVFDLAGSWPSV